MTRVHNERAAALYAALEQMIARLPERGKHREFVELDSYDFATVLAGWLIARSYVQSLPDYNEGIREQLCNRARLAAAMRVVRAIPYSARHCHAAALDWCRGERRLDQLAVSALVNDLSERRLCFDREPPPGVIGRPQFVPQAAQSSAPFWLWAAPGAIVPAHDALIAAHIRNWRAEAAESWSSFLSALFEAGPSRVARTLWHARKVLPRGCVEARRELRRLCAHIRALFISAAIAAQSGDRAVIVRAFEIYFGGQLPEWIGTIKKLCAGEYDWPAQFTGRKRPIEVAAVELAEVDI